MLLRSSRPIVRLAVGLAASGFGGLVLHAQAKGAPVPKAPPPPASTAPKPDSRLSAGDVERITRLRGVQLVGRAEVPGAGAGLNFVDADRRMVLEVVFGPASDYSTARSQTQMTMGGRHYPMHLFHASVPNIGDEAFDSPPGPRQFALYIRKGDHSVSLTTFLLPTGKMALTMDQLKMLGGVVASRM